eukprot:TRINITY_DN300_c0_g1_i10.p2 TRINITY_DN300_c0_g1~~TRINITY_DN300_c0_g1_i10.p2  ORF type:complete len:273 (+),score=77.72 TRINITY_DN300_c0_g1_i10:101-919(+)
MSSVASTAINKAQCIITEGSAEFQNRYAQLKENATQEKVKENYEQMIVEVKTRLDSLLKLMKELVEATQTEGAKTFEKSKEALEAAQKKVQSLIAKFEALLKDLQQKMTTMYVTYVPEGRRQEISKFLEGSAKQLNEGLLQVKDAYKAKEQQGVAQYGKVVEWATEKSAEVQTKVTDLTNEHVKPRFESAKEMLGKYSPDAMEKANEGVAALMDTEETYFARLTAFIYIIFQAMVMFAQQGFSTKKADICTLDEEAKSVDSQPKTPKTSTSS